MSRIRPNPHHSQLMNIAVCAIVHVCIDLYFVESGCWTNLSCYLFDPAFELIKSLFIRNCIQPLIHLIKQYKSLLGGDFVY